MRTRFRIDVALLGEDSQIADLTVHGSTLEEALIGAMVLMAPHIEGGLTVQVLQSGVWCDTCRAYHPCTDRLLRMHHGEDVEVAPPTPLTN